ncbi:MAG: Arc family DNA-binding protein [Stenotrophomonas sp.]|uniref:Arc family DNA-binding protein n=1 Tax=Stenotrophomonas sp. TaxID=69392 RepID=UPI003D6D2B04
MARTDPQVNVRMPADLKGRLEDAASESGRSVTGEIVHRLESTFPKTLDWLRHNRAEEVHTLRVAVDQQVQRVSALKATGLLQQHDLLELGRRRLLLQTLESDAHMLEMMDDVRPDELIDFAEVGATPPISMEAHRNAKKAGT